MINEENKTHSATNQKIPIPTQLNKETLNAASGYMASDDLDSAVEVAIKLFKSYNPSLKIISEKEKNEILRELELIKQLIAKANLEDAIDRTRILIEELDQGSGIKNHFFHIVANYKKLDQDSTELAQIQLSKIYNDLLELLDLIKREYLDI